jgi:hypothetical protein
LRAGGCLGERALDGFTSIDEVSAPGELQAIAEEYEKLIGLARR